MLERTKKRPTEEIELRFRGPAALREEAARSLKALGFVDLSETVPWREAFPEFTAEEGPGIVLRAVRRREGLTQKELAERSGIAQAHISEMERGKIAIGVTRAKRLSKVLNVGYKIFL